MARKIPASLPERKPTKFIYTEAMRERALARIAEKRAREDPELIFKNYMRVMSDRPDAIRHGRKRDGKIAGSE
jgi:hypothetical protein